MKIGPFRLFQHFANGKLQQKEQNKIIQLAKDAEHLLPKKNLIEHLVDGNKVENDD